HYILLNFVLQPNQYHKVEKADILNLCQSVFEGITNIAKDEPGKYYPLPVLLIFIHWICFIQQLNEMKLMMSN
ncbi:uncharacterized protein DC041_0003666, partial [Schistosoma bovis]